MRNVKWTVMNPQRIITQLPSAWSSVLESFSAFLFWFHNHQLCCFGSLSPLSLMLFFKYSRQLLSAKKSLTNPLRYARCLTPNSRQIKFVASWWKSVFWRPQQRRKELLHYRICEVDKNPILDECWYCFMYAVCVYRQHFAKTLAIKTLYSDIQCSVYRLFCRPEVAKRNYHCFKVIYE